MKTTKTEKDVQAAQAAFREALLRKAESKRLKR